AGFAAAGAALSVGRGEIASSAVLQAGETLAALRLRHSSASRVPGLTPVQFDMKSERQEARIAEICSDVGCWAEAESVAAIKSPPATSTRTARRGLSQELPHQEPHVTQNLPFWRRHVAQSCRRRPACALLP